MKADEGLTAAGYGLIKGETLAGWADGTLPWASTSSRAGWMPTWWISPWGGGGSAALRVVGVHTSVLPVFDGERLTGLAVNCRVEANLAEGDVTFQDEAALAELEQALAETEKRRMEGGPEALPDAGRRLPGPPPPGGPGPPLHKEALEGASLAGLEVELTVTARIRRGYDATR